MTTIGVEMNEGSPAFRVLGSQIGQVGLVVSELERAVTAHADLGPWTLWTYDRTFVTDLEIAGRPADCRFRVALNRGQPQLEIIQPLDDDSPYAHWIAETGGVGIHHLGFYVDDVRAATAAMEAEGYATIMTGSGYGADGTGGFGYFDTVAELGFVVEAIEVPGKRREPEAIWHAQAA